MAEWLYEAGIGENRAARIENGRIVAARIERPDLGPRAGTVAPVRLVETLAGGAAIVRFNDDAEALLDRVPPGASIGSQNMVEIVREAIPEPGKVKRALARAAPDAPPRDGPSLLERISATGSPVRQCRPHETPDAFEDAGWSELLDEAATGEVAFPSGALRISLTPAMTLIDIDGIPGDAYALARAGVRAACEAVVRIDIAGSIGIDLPTMAERAQRLAIADIVDDVLPQPFERTAVNGFGFLQIVRRRVRPSLAEMIRYRPVESAALALLRRAERSRGTGTAKLVSAPPIIVWLDRHAALIEELARRLGRPVELHADAEASMDGGHVG